MKRKLYCATASKCAYIMYVCTIFSWKSPTQHTTYAGSYTRVPVIRVSGNLILPGEPLAKGYYKWHPERKEKKTYRRAGNFRGINFCESK